MIDERSPRARGFSDVNFATPISMTSRSSDDMRINVEVRLQHFAVFIFSCGEANNSSGSTCTFPLPFGSFSNKSQKRPNKGLTM